MCQKIRKERITKAEFYARGGFSNSALFRQQSRGGAWRYYVDIEKDAMQRRATVSPALAAPYGGSPVEPVEGDIYAAMAQAVRSA